MFYRNVVHPSRMSGSWRSRVQFGSATSTPKGGLLFDEKNPNTMTKPQDVSTKWSKSTVEMTSHSLYGVVTVYDNSFGATEVISESRAEVEKMHPIVYGSWDVHTHCEWCGQSINYVAIIYGVDTITGASTVHHIGCDCLGKIFGVRWFGYRNAESVRKTLVKTAKIRRRAAEYPVKYAKELAWLDSLPDTLLSRNIFLHDMKNLLRSGERAVSKKMENYLHALMSRKEYDPKEYAVAEREIKNVSEKIRGILHLIEEVDSEEHRTSPYSAYTFVSSVLSNFERYHRPLTKKQMSALNKVYVKYRDLRIGKHVGSSLLTNKMKGNPNDVPW